MKKNELKRREFLQNLGAFSMGIALAGCGGGGGSDSIGGGAREGAISLDASNAQPVPDGTIVSGTIALNGTSGMTIGSTFAGLSYEKGMINSAWFQSSNTALVNLFKLLGSNMLRIGGNSADTTTWTATGAGLTAQEVAPADVDRLAGFLEATGWSVVYDINLKTSTAALAAAEVAYVSNSLGSQLVYVEIGNEPDAYGWTYAEYLSSWQSFATAILAETPGVKLAAPGLAYRGNVATWTANMVPAVGSTLSAVTQHYYRAGPTGDTVSGMLVLDTKLKTVCSTLVSAGAGLPFRFTEFGSNYGGGAEGVSNSNGSALWAIDDLFTVAAGGGQGVNFHGGGSTYYTSIVNSSDTITGINPQFYGLLLFVLAGTGTLQPITLDSGGLNVTAYAILNANGNVSFIVQNMDTSSLNVSINAGTALGSANLTLLTSSSLTDTTGTTIQGATVGVDGSYTAGTPYALTTSGSTCTAYVNPGSSALIQVVPS